MLNLKMSTVELIDFSPELAANSAPRPVADLDVVSTRATAARGFLIQLVAREVQLSPLRARWLREVGQQLQPMHGAACERLASETELLHEHLRELVERLVGRWNWLERHRRIDALRLLEQPPSRAVAELIELHEQHLISPTPWLELAALRSIEQMLAVVVPLAIDLAGFARGEVVHAELADAALLFATREQRACSLAELLAELIAAEPERSALVDVAEEQAITSFTKVLAECAQIGRYRLIR